MILNKWYHHFALLLPVDCLYELRWEFCWCHSLGCYKGNASFWRDFLVTALFPVRNSLIHFATSRKICNTQSWQMKPSVGYLIVFLMMYQYHGYNKNHPGLSLKQGKEKPKCEVSYFCHLACIEVTTFHASEGTRSSTRYHLIAQTRSFIWMMLTSAKSLLICTWYQSTWNLQLAYLKNA